MTKVNNILKENYNLKKELDTMISTLKENEAKHKGFKVVEYACLLSETLGGISAKPLKYMEDIFELEKAVLFIKAGSYPIASGCVRAGDRVYICRKETFDYTFLEKRPYGGDNHMILHKDFKLMSDEEGYSFVIAPVMENENITAAIGLYSKDKDRFSSDHKFDFVAELTFIMAIALRKLNDAYMLAMQAQTDYLTGLPNKSMMELTADRWLDRYKKHKIPFAFYLLDLDNFKQVNDLEGHITGDKVLKQVSKKVRDVIGDSDVLGRFGGDEFYLFAEISHIDNIVLMEQNILEGIDQISDTIKMGVLIGLSGGGVRIPEDIDKANTFMELVKLADERLYIIKDSGKGGFCGVTDDYKQK